HMNDGVDVVLIQVANHFVAIHEIGMDKNGFGRYGPRMALAQIVINNDFVTAFDQLFDDHAPDVAGAAGDQNLHRLGTFLCSKHRFLREAVWQKFTGVETGGEVGNSEAPPCPGALDKKSAKGRTENRAPFTPFQSSIVNLLWGLRRSASRRLAFH